eukprot:TRINITY_DN6535_c0_g1_i1.p1 TRINITY_DN6535_c0_g1~~TRINITY_DN6535_c0_g1_i1.p1  ORF type:complete len:107 (-),score=56.13 TRINITY_DN6535_c0_g1_i1:84-404(-)
MMRRPPRSTQSRSSAASDVYKRQIMDAVKPVEGEAVIVKGYPNSFHATNLHELLQGKNVKNLVVAGFMTHMCINSTARGAFNLGYNVVVPADCLSLIHISEPTRPY